ncbi:hypothetical protein COR52_23935 [Vibrio mediterranei]|uniref:Uncharacterized protein n=1 Tax=Vibrio mediterranei TaxID=689 RepID=A0ABX5D9C3_9VIBR|nr:hypothetical protein COR52_23935 [Vibrio mediterranei]PRQ65633.1 hypothetical protein COR51_21450 [Vibrio mediterranei]
MHSFVSKIRANCVDQANSTEKIVNNLDLIHWITDHLLAILVINR